MNSNSLVYVAGHQGMVGSAIVRCLISNGFKKLILKSRAELDLTSRGEVDTFFAHFRPEYVFIAAAKVGGILANDSRPAEFLKENLDIQTNLIDAAYRNGTHKLLFLGSSCIYPKHASQPMTEDCLLTGPLEETNQWYAVAKIAGLKMCQAYRRQYGFNAISAMPTNLYGPFDNFNLQSSHVLPALIRKVDDAKEKGEDAVTIWGTGNPRREFLHVDDLADACVFLMQKYEDDLWINVGCGTDVTIRELAETVSGQIGFRGKFNFDVTKPDGTPRKLLDTTKINSLGWNPRIALDQGIASTYRWFLANRASIRT